MIVSIFLASNKPANLQKFFDNINNSLHDKSAIEILIAIDDNNRTIQNIVSKAQIKYKFLIKHILISPKEIDYYSLEKAYNRLFFEECNKDSYFCWLLTDEIRFHTHNWDQIIKKYIGFFQDNIFRLKISPFKLKNYFDFFECMPCPDNFALTTRKWLELCGGWGEFWGPDSWHQCIDYYLQKSNIDRSIPIFDLDIRGQEAGLGISCPKSLNKRIVNIKYGWNKFTSLKYQRKYYFYAKKIEIYMKILDLNIRKGKVIKHKNKFQIIDDSNNSQYYISYSPPSRSVSFCIGDKKINFLSIVEIAAMKIKLFFIISHIILRFRCKIIDSLPNRLGNYVASLYISKFIPKFFKRQIMKFLHYICNLVIRTMQTIRKLNKPIFYIKDYNIFE